MVSPVYDYMVAIIVVGAIFVGCVIVMPYINLRNLLAVDQQQLRNTALNTLDAMLLGTGYPTDWGSEVNDTFYFQPGIVEGFGLASARRSTFYMLDQDKIQRLDTNNPLGYLGYDQVQALLKLQNHGFHFRIIPPFSITNVDGTRIDEDHSPINREALENGVLEYGVKVSYLDGRPIYNATILATAIFTSIAQGDDTGTKFLECVRTDILGTCRQNCTLVTPPDELTSVIVTLQVSVAEIATLVVTFGESPQTLIDINMVDDTVVLTEPKETSNAAIEIRAIYVQGSQDTPWLLYEGQGPPEDKFNTGEGQHLLWNRTFSGLSDHDVAILLLHINKDGEEIVVAGPHRNLSGCSACDYGSPVESATAAVKLQRNAIIASTTYTVELWLWKESL